MSFNTDMMRKETHKDHYDAWKNRRYDNVLDAKIDPRFDGIFRAYMLMVIIAGFKSIEYWLTHYAFQVPNAVLVSQGSSAKAG